MGKRDARVDAYIDKAEPFAQPILRKIRTLFHKGCPGLEETIKWGAPSFEYKGLMGGMASFRKHVSFGFWKASLMKDPQGLLKAAPGQSNFSFKAQRVRDIPDDDVFLAYVTEARRLNDEGIKAPTKRHGERKKLEVPDYFQRALQGNPDAQATFESFSWSKRRDYVTWLTEAKREATREKRLATAITWLAEGKSRNWKYEKC